MISFIIYFHSSRIKNLEQTLRFLEKREPDLVPRGELVLICQDYTKCVKSKFQKQHFNLEMETYNKPQMCNYGVSKSNYENIVLLDSDRILPSGYFTNNLLRLQSNQLISTINLYTLSNHYSDKEIENDIVDSKKDFRSIENEGRKKNIFSGNTLMKKEDYIRCGGMDESFVGYGFADNDMTKNVMSKGMEIIYLNEKEYHLKHPKGFYSQNEFLYRKGYRIFTAVNGMKYHLKWNIQIDHRTWMLLEEIKNSIHEFQEDSQKKFVDLLCDCHKYLKFKHLKPDPTNYFL